MSDAREAHLVQLVDDAGRTVGECRVDEAHQAPGRLHRAFSVLLLDSAGRILLQLRAATKTRFPLTWANACCGHPAPGQSVPDAANRRLGEELGIGPIALTEIGVYVYQAGDPTTGRVEYEYDHVLRGELSPDVPLRLDPDEVAAVRWVTRDELRSELERRPRDHAPWLGGVARRLFPPGANGTPAGSACSDGAPAGAAGSEGNPGGSAGSHGALSERDGTPAETGGPTRR
jgi:isopentenyl-diphosphate delta-isomerase